MWTRWLPWRFLIRSMARAQGFLDPIALITHLQRFSQPSEVVVPTELLRAGALLQAKGLVNSQAIQHNRDWIWPFWVERQFDPRDEAFVPRAFNMTHINLTHRNWTAVGLPDEPEMPIVDPRGLLTPHFDGWSVDAWIVSDDGEALIPSREPSVRQDAELDGNLGVRTRTAKHSMRLLSNTEVIEKSGEFFCRFFVEGESDKTAWLVISLRPYNPEGVSFIHEISRTSDRPGWKVNGREFVYLSEEPARQGFSRYENGDVYRWLFSLPNRDHVTCDVGMASAAALYPIWPDKKRQVMVTIPLTRKKAKAPAVVHPPGFSHWDAVLGHYCQMKVPDERFQFLYETAIRTLILHSPGEVYPGPYTYKRFWFRDAAFILNAMLAAGLTDRVERAIERFLPRQTPFGYFLSQEGEWDSNGEALWIMRRFVELSGKPAKESWRGPILRAARWIERKRLPSKSRKSTAGLLPAGFSAEHLGPTDFYYWDNFWGIAGLRAAAHLLELLQDKEAAGFRAAAEEFTSAIEHSIERATRQTGSFAIPASPHRRLDAGAIGSLAAGYPLLIWGEKDRRLVETADYLLKNHFLDGAFFQEISHSGMNPYLSLHVAEVFLRAGDPRFFSIVQSVAALASSTGQWPEAVHPKTKGGCMGDGQHVWASAEWVMILRNMFVWEEENPPRLVLCSGIPPSWLIEGAEISFGPTPTAFGAVSVHIKVSNGKPEVSWEGKWRGTEPPAVEVRLNRT